MPRRMAPTTGAPGLVARLDAHTVRVMNTPLQYTQEAFDILNGIADDALSLAFAAECVAPPYIEQCLHTVLQFHPYADRVKVAETSMTLAHGGISVTYEIMPHEYVDQDETPKTYRFHNEEKGFSDEAYLRITEGEYLLAYQVLRESYQKDRLPPLGEPCTWMIDEDEHEALIVAFQDLAEDFPDDAERFIRILDWITQVPRDSLSIDL